MDGHHIIPRVDRNSSYNTSLQGHRQIGESHIAVYRIDGSVGILIVILDHVSGRNVEKTVAADHGWCGLLKANQRNGYRRRSLFLCPRKQLQRHLNVLDIVLRQRKNFLIISNHARCNRTAAPVRDLEIFIHRAAAENLHRAGTGNKAPGIEVCLVIHGDLASRSHIDHAQRSARVTVCVFHIGAHHTANRNRSIDSNIGTVRHCQRAENTGCNIIVFTTARSCSV